MVCSENIYLNPHRKMVTEVVDWLCDPSRLLCSPAGVKSLAHILVVVPTAQSGRRLRVALAMRLGQVLPPKVVLASYFLTNDKPLASRVDQIVAFWQAEDGKQALDVAMQLVDIRRILQANALTFADVAEKIPNILTGEMADVEIKRWQKLALLEKRYLEILDGWGKIDPIVEFKNILDNPPVLEGIQQIVLACTLDILPVAKQVIERVANAQSLPLIVLMPEPATSDEIPIKRAQVIPCGTTSSEAWHLAEQVAKVKDNEALPALCLVDSTLFTEVHGALQAKGISAHNPSAMPLIASPLGHLVEQLAELSQTQAYDVFSAFIRMGDVRRWLQQQLSISDDVYAEQLSALDRLQAQLLPEKISDIAPSATGDLKRIFTFVQELLSTMDLQTKLQEIFKDYDLDESNAEARSFASAAEVVNQLIDMCFDAHVPLKLQMELFNNCMKDATYTLEPNLGNEIQTDGWLELIFLDADEVFIGGMQEGCVPQSVVGHAFLPDSLRMALGLPCNETYVKRDAEILRLAVSCREIGAVQISFHAVDVAGDVLKPSRLLLRCANNDDFLERVHTFYTIRPGTEEIKASKSLPEKWRLNLKIPPEYKELEYISPSSLDRYLQCPFTYYLKEQFGEPLNDNAEELDAREFGTLVHKALQNWATGNLRDSEDEKAIAANLSKEIDNVLAERFGKNIPVIVSLQGESSKLRLQEFAKRQVEWHRQGWRVVSTERSMRVKYDHTVVRGRCDRIDYNENFKKWCVIDYKTWDSLEKAKEFDKSLQLPLYVAMLDVDISPKFADAHRDQILATYCVIGESAREVEFMPPINGGSLPEAEETVRQVIENIEKGIFWPPSTDNRWKYDYQPWIKETPQESVCAEWIADQKRRSEREEHL